MSSNNSSKNLWCRDTLVQKMINDLGRNPFIHGKGFSIRVCKNGKECKGAHSSDEIVIFPNIRAWNNTDKTTINFPELYFQIIDVINNDKTKIKSSDDASKDFITRIQKLSEYNFIEVLQLWRELATYYRRISKNPMLPMKSKWTSNINPHYNSSGYIFKEDVPYFGLDQRIEEHAWSLERLTKRCNIVMKNVESINKRTPMQIWDICVGDKNCKEGYHNINDSLCIEDFLTGKCSCIPKKDYEEIISDLKTKIETCHSEMQSEEIKMKRLNHLRNLVDKTRSELLSVYRKIHYTDQGMVPFDEQLIKYKADKAKEDERLKMEKEKEAKPSWDRKIENKSNSGGSTSASSSGSSGCSSPGFSESRKAIKIKI